MPDRNQHDDRVKQLLAQETAINDTNFKEFRMQLEQSLAACEQKSQRVRRRIVIGIIVYFVGMLMYMLLLSIYPKAPANAAAVVSRGMIMLPFLIAAMTAGILGLNLLVRYIFIHAPRLSRARFDLQTSLLLELQQQVKQLQEDLGKKS